MRRLDFLTLLFILLAASPASVQATDLFRDPPPDYERLVGPRFMSLEEVLKQKDAFSVKDGDSATLLDEAVDLVDAKGRVLSARHLVRRSFNDAGSKEVATQTYVFRGGEQKIFLLLARTILPDGRQLQVQPNAALIKSPQRDSEDSLYSDQDELVLIFPNISAGAITESIIVTEERDGRIPRGVFARFFLAQLVADRDEAPHR